MRRVGIKTAESFIGSGSPIVEPLTKTEVKLQRRIAASSTTLDSLLDIWIASARQHFEEQTGRQCITATWEYWLECFPSHGVIELPHPPLQSVESVKYDDGSGTEQTIDASAYTVETPSGPYCAPGRIVLNTGGTWPVTVADDRYSVRIRFVAGYGDTESDVPPIVRAALLYLVGNYHKFAEDTAESNGTLQQVPTAATKMIEAFKYSALPLHPLTRGCCEWSQCW